MACLFCWPVLISLVKRCANKNDITPPNIKENEKGNDNEKKPSNGVDETEVIDVSAHNSEKIRITTGDHVLSEEAQAQQKKRKAAAIIYKYYLQYSIKKLGKEIKKRENAVVAIQSCLIRMYLAQKMYEQETRHVLNYSLTKLHLYCQENGFNFLRKKALKGLLKQQML